MVKPIERIVKKALVSLSDISRICESKNITISQFISTSERIDLDKNEYRKTSNQIKNSMEVLENKGSMKYMGCTIFTLILAIKQYIKSLYPRELLEKLHNFIVNYNWKKTYWNCKLMEQICLFFDENSHILDASYMLNVPSDTLRRLLELCENVECLHFPYSIICQLEKSDRSVVMKYKVAKINDSALIRDIKKDDIIVRLEAECQLKDINIDKIISEKEDLLRRVMFYIGAKI